MGDAARRKKLGILPDENKVKWYPLTAVCYGHFPGNFIYDIDKGYLYSPQLKVVASWVEGKLFLLDRAYTRKFAENVTRQPSVDTFFYLLEAKEVKINKYNTLLSEFGGSY